MGSSFIHLFLYHVLNLTWFPCHLHQLYRMRVFFLQQHYSLNICGLSSSVPRINSHKQQHLFAPESRTPPSWYPPSLTNSSTPDLNPADAPIKQNLGWDAILWMKPNTALSYVLKLLSSVVQFSCSVVSDSLRPHGLQQARIPCPSPTPGVYSNSRPLSSDAIQPSMGFKLLHCDIICIPYNSSPFKASDSVVFSLSTGVCNYNNNACMLNRVQLCATPWTGLPGFSVHGISQARIPEWVAISFSRESSRLSSQSIFAYFIWLRKKYWSLWLSCLIPVLNILYEGIIIIHGLLHLVSFPEPTGFKVHPCCSM